MLTNSSVKSHESSNLVILTSADTTDAWIPKNMVLKNAPENNLCTGSMFSLKWLRSYKRLLRVGGYPPSLVFEDLKP